MPIARRPFRPAAVLLAAAVALAFSSPAAHACRGSAEFPEAEKKLSASSLPAEEKAMLQKLLGDGRAEHDKAHQENDMSRMKKSLETLDKVKSKL